MKMYDEVEVLQSKIWYEGYIYIAPYNEKHIVVREDTGDLSYIEECRISFYPRIGEKIMVRNYEDGGWDYRTFFAMDNDRFVCRDINSNTGFYSWAFAKRDE